MMTIPTESHGRLPPPPRRVDAAGLAEAAPASLGFPFAESLDAPPAKAAARGAVRSTPSVRRAGDSRGRSADVSSRVLTQSERRRAMAALAASGFALGALAGLAFVMSWS